MEIEERLLSRSEKSGERNNKRAGRAEIAHKVTRIAPQMPRDRGRRRTNFANGSSPSSLPAHRLRRALHPQDRRDATTQDLADARCDRSCSGACRDVRRTTFRLLRGGSIRDRGCGVRAASRGLFPAVVRQATRSMAWGTPASGDTESNAAADPPPL